jgi:ankyrin repeat protein
LKDLEGQTALHLAVKSTEKLKSGRPVRALLMRGADKMIKDKNAKLPEDLIKDITSESLQKELINSMSTN